MASLFTIFKGLQILFIPISEIFRVPDLPDSIQELKENIMQAFRNIDEDTLKNVYNNMRNRLWVVQRGEGGHSKLLINWKRYGYCPESSKAITLN